MLNPYKKTYKIPINLEVSMITAFAPGWSPLCSASLRAEQVGGPDHSVEIGVSPKDTLW
jgi:hypothetical protein